MTRLWIVFMFFASMALGACSTFHGMGKDIKETGDFLSGTPATDAYHQTARDF